jgi:hypothetical protein
MTSSKRPKARDQRTEDTLRDAERQGFRVDTGKGRTANHFKVWAPDGSFVTTFASTPSDRRGYLNSLAYLKRAGYQPPAK